MSLLATLLAVVAAASLLAAAGRRASRQRSARRSRAVDFLMADHPRAPTTPGPRPSRWVASRPGPGRLTALLPPEHVDRVKRLLVLAGHSDPYEVEQLVTLQVVGAAAGGASAGAAVAAGAVTGSMAWAAVAVGTVVGALAPLSRLQRAARQRQAAIDAHLADAVELLALAVDAGLGLDAALTVVSERFLTPIGQEFTQVLAEISLGRSRAEAFQALRERTDSGGVAELVVAVIQADQLGTPLAQVLTRQAGNARRRRAQQARERANRLPVKILVPTTTLIFPPTLVILLGPAFADIRAMLS